jgi:hypothetical protein
MHTGWIGVDRHENLGRMSWNGSERDWTGIVDGREKDTSTGRTGQ